MTNEEDTKLNNGLDNSLDLSGPMGMAGTELSPLNTSGPRGHTTNYMGTNYIELQNTAQATSPTSPAGLYQEMSNRQSYAAPTNRNYSFLAGTTQMENIRPKTPVASICQESEKLRKLKEKKENKHKRKDKNVNVYTTGPPNTEKAEGFDINKVLESLGETQSDRYQEKKNKKTTKTSNNKQGDANSTEKNKNQRRSYEKTNVPVLQENTDEQVTTSEKTNGHGKQNEVEINSATPLSERMLKIKKDQERDINAVSVYDNPQVQEMIDPSSDPENQFTTVHSRKNKNNKVSKQSYGFRDPRSGKWSNILNGSSNNRERGTMGNNGAKTSSASTNSGALSDTNSSHQETPRNSSSSAALVNMNTDPSSKYSFYQQSHQKSTGTSSITSDSVTGESISESASLATDLDLAADFPPLGLNENSAINNLGNVQIFGNGDEHPTTLMANRAPLPKAVWPIKPNVSTTSDSTAVIENINNNTNVNENVNNKASETNNSNNAVVSPDVSLSTISTSSFMSVNSNISNIPSSQFDGKSNNTGSSTNVASVAQGNGTQTMPSYSKALLGNKSSQKANGNQPSKHTKMSNLPATPQQQQNVMLIDANPPDITVQAKKSLKPRSSLPDVTAQAPTSTEYNISVNSTPNRDSGTNSPSCIATTNLSSIETPPYTNTVDVTDEYKEGIITPAMQQKNSILHDTISPATFVQSSSPSSCFFVDDNRAVAIVLSERAYNNSYPNNTDGQNVNVGTANIGNEQHSSVPAVTILGRGDTPVADWSSRCDGLEFGGPINEDLLSMDYATPYNVTHQVISNYIQPHDSYYQEMLVTNVNSNMSMDPVCTNGNSEHITYKRPQCMVIQDMAQDGPIPLPDMDKAIVSFGESLEHANKMDYGINSSSQAAHQTSGTNSNELNIQDPNDNMRRDGETHYESYENSESVNLSGLSINTNLKYSEDGTGNISSHSVTSISPNSIEENDPHNVPLNNELNDFSATNWAHQVESFQIENEQSHGEDQQSSPFIEGNLVYNSTAAINEANNKVNYNYQEILSFVSNSWQQVEKELTSGAPGKYYYSKSVSNNKNNSSIAKLNNNLQKH